MGNHNWDILNKAKGFRRSKVQNFEIDGWVKQVAKFKPRDLASYKDKIILPLVVDTGEAVQ